MVPFLVWIWFALATIFYRKASQVRRNVLSKSLDRGQVTFTREFDKQIPFLFCDQPNKWFKVLINFLRSQFCFIWSSSASLRYTNLFTQYHCIIGLCLSPCVLAKMQNAQGRVWKDILGVDLVSGALINNRSPTKFNHH